MNQENKEVLDEINKGCNMGKDALSVILEKSEDNGFKKIIFDILKKYDLLSEHINKLYENEVDEEPKDTSTMSKIMTWYGIQMKTISDSTTSKLSELTLQGLNMGIIEGRKFLNDRNLNKEVKKILNEYVDIQEEYVEIIKNYL